MGAPTSYLLHMEGKVIITASGSFVCTFTGVFTVLWTAKAFAAGCSYKMYEFNVEDDEYGEKKV